MLARVLRKEFWSIIVATLVTMLIWIWAARETRDQRQVVLQVQFVAPNPDDWVIDAAEDMVRVTIDGSRQAVREFAGQTHDAFRFSIGSNGVPTTLGTHVIDMATLLGNDDAFTERGLAVVECVPASLQIDLDRMTKLTAEVLPELPGARVEGERVVDPSIVTIYMPQKRAAPYTSGTLSLTARAEPAQIEHLEPGRPHTLTVPVAPPDALAGNTHVRIDPPTVQVTFTIRSQIRQTTLDSVRVQLAGPPEDGDDYRVQVDPTFLPRVTISADAELIRKITEDGLPVFAFVHVSSREKEQAITSKPISFLEAIVPTEDGNTVGMPVTFVLGPGETMPLVKLTITARDAGTPADSAAGD